MDIAGLQALLTPLGQRILTEAAAADLSEAGLLATASRLRERHPADLVAAALTQVRLRVRARAKFGPSADRMYFTPTGLEQATRATVAAHRARRFATLPECSRTLELGCGIGGDLIARASDGTTGGRSVAIELDPLTAAVATANLSALGLSARAVVQVGDATSADPTGHSAVFCDPGRRTGAARRVFDPRAYAPPLDTVLELTARVPAACVKVAPGIPYEALPADAEVEWISDAGEVKEAALWLGEFAGSPGGGARTPLRRATLLRPGSPAATLVAGAVTGDTADTQAAPVRGWGRYLYEPDGAVIRAHLVAEVAAQLDGGLADPQIAYITTDTLRDTPFARPYEIDDVMPFSLKRLRAELRRREVGTVTIKKRGSAVDIERLRKDLRLGGPAEATIVLTRVGSAPTALLCRPVQRHPSSPS